MYLDLLLQVCKRTLFAQDDGSHIVQCIKFQDVRRSLLLSSNDCKTQDCSTFKAMKVVQLITIGNKNVQLVS
jgi:hypothetical protein